MGTRSVSNTCPGKPGEVADDPVHGHPGDPGARRSSLHRPTPRAASSKATMRPHDLQPDRRRFLAWASTAAALLVAHDGLAAEGRPACSPQEGTAVLRAERERE